MNKHVPCGEKLMDLQPPSPLTWAVGYEYTLLLFNGAEQAKGTNLCASLAGWRVL